MPGHGHFFPTLPLARALVDAGHEVSYCSSATYGSTITEHGFEHLRVGLDYTLGGGGTALDAAGGIGAVEYLMFVEGPIAVARDLVERFKTQRPDAVLVDPVEFGAMTACEAVDLPWGAFVNGIRTFEMIGQLPFGFDERNAVLAERFDVPVNRRREAVGLGPSRLRPSESPYDRTFALMMAPPSLEAFPLEQRTHTGHHLRPEVHSSAAPDLTSAAGRERPLVVVTFGTLFGTAELYAVAVEGALATGADVVAVTSESFGVLHDRLFSMPWASMDRLLERADVVVHHGGWGSMIGALATGKPSVVVPLGAEQPTNAARIASVGAGIALDKNEVRLALSDAISALLDEPVYRLNAERLRAEIQAMPAAADVVPLIERLAAEGVPMMNHG